MYGNESGGGASPLVSINLNNPNDDDDPTNADSQPIHAEAGSVFTLGAEIQRSLVGQKMNVLRSPSRESIGTDISLFSVSTLASEMTNRAKLLSVRMANERFAVSSRGPSPNFESKGMKKPENIREIWFEDAYDMIKGMAALSSAVGASKSFSTSDITNLPYTTNDDEGGSLDIMKRNVSEPAISCCQHAAYLLQRNMRVENSSLSCSTWVAVGDVVTSSQLPSPYAIATAPVQQNISSKMSSGPVFSPADLVRSVNKKVRQHYIRRRLLNTYKALERLSQSEFNLDKLEIEAAASAHGQIQSRMSTIETTNEFMAEGSAPLSSCRKGAGREGINSPVTNRLSVPATGSATTFDNRLPRTGMWRNASVPGVTYADNQQLTVMDIERGQGQPLTKYDRNMMIFNWLLTLEPEDYTLTPDYAGTTS